MSIARDGQRMHVCCDNCPDSYPNTYALEDFSLMISDAKTAGWIIRKAGPRRDHDGMSDLFGQPPRDAGSTDEQPFIHTCPECRTPADTGGMF